MVAAMPAPPISYHDGTQSTLEKQQPTLPDFNSVRFCRLSNG
jgi:hypothetical protein